MAKLTLLEKYQIAFAEMVKDKGALSLEQAWSFQELLYRIEVLQVCQMFTMTAPVGNDLRAMVTHYQMVDGYFENLRSERRNGLVASEKEQKQRETVSQNLSRITNDYRKRFSSFSPSAPDQYKNEISRVISTMLPAWIQMRNVYAPIKMKEE